MIEKLKHKYAFSDKGAHDMMRAFVAVTIANLVLMLGTFVCAFFIPD